LERSKGEILQLKKQAEEKDRHVDALTFSHVICRPTEEDALASTKCSSKIK
jgi:alkanesulfonate monooxygenase SsuD/methylene tetrahydromethanopterin reductase-like flavin-dependent oxidoreductase (luciferase family)